MAIEIPAGDLARTRSHEPDQSWPASVKVQLLWEVNGAPRVRTVVIDADYFFGRGQYGAPMEGVALLQMVERLRREGPPVCSEPRTFVPNQKGKSRGRQR